jgi:asparagine synthase (glutamine-hydrolysing)
MCGIAGLMRANVLQRTDAERDVPAMARALTHRGPDDEGVWLDADAGVALCHRRLSIIDLSPLGHQPMISASGRYVIVFNGEIYNYLDLRRDLVARGAAFRGTSDTEVLLAAIEAWGVAAAIERAQGMFAIALWDRHERELFLARDRFGEKPLYYGICNGVLLFGSELKALREHASWDGEIDRDALSLFMQHDFIPAPFSIFKRIRKVRAGAIVSVRPVDRALQIAEHRYWRPEALFDAAAREQRNLSPEGYVDLIEGKLGAAVRRQMVADVPLGAFLSGGTDSSLVVALMQHASTQRVKTFSIGFAEREYDESPFARAVAAHLRTDHSELIVTPGDCLDVIPKLPHIYDEPFADSSQIPTYLVASLARKDAGTR